MKSKFGVFLIMTGLVLVALVIGCASKPAASSTTPVIPPTTAAAITPPVTTTSALPSTTASAPPAITTSALPPTVSAPPTTTTSIPPPVTASAPPATPPSTEAKVVIDVDDSSFTPPVLTISVGTDVTWVDIGESPHTIVSDTGLFSKTLVPDGKFDYVFSTVGTYKYYDPASPLLIGTIIVQ